MLAQSHISPSQPVALPHLSSPDTLVSPGDTSWDCDNQSSYPTDAMDVVGWNYYTLPPSPPASVSSNADESPRLCRRTIRPRSTPEFKTDSEQKPCPPTSQVFEFDAMEPPSCSSSASPPPSMPRQLTISSSDSENPLSKSFTAIGGVKKGRGNGERITTRDFVPPDVTGLSKREARLLKNRAAAFLSRQRKREEFEAMEIRVKELEEENSRLQVLVAKGKKYDDLLSSMEELRLRLSMAEKRERELTVELENRTATSLAIKTESFDLNLPPYSSLAATGQASTVTIMKQSLLSSLPSLLCLPSQTSLPVDFSVPLAGSSSASPPSASYDQQSASCDIKGQGRSRFGHEGIGFHYSSVDVESLKKMAFGGEAPEMHKFDMDGLHCYGSFAISFDVSPAEDGRGCVHVQISEGLAKHTAHGNRPSLTSWSGTDATFGMACGASPVSISSHGIDHVGVFSGAGNGHSRMSFDAQLMSESPGYTSYAEPSFDFYPGIIPI